MRNTLAYVLLLAAAGCEKTDPNFCRENPGASGCPMPMIDAGDELDAPDGFIADAQQCFGAGDYTICLAALPMSDLPLLGDFNTDGSTSCLSPTPEPWLATQGDACVVAARDITTTNLNVLGTRRLVLIATNTVTISGVLDVASRRIPSSKVGPGANPTTCGTFSDVPDDSSNGAGGGAGGSFITSGGEGGAGNSVSGSGGATIPTSGAAPSLLRGGCPGQKGGAGDSAMNGGDGGPGGGAVFITAGTSIVFLDNAIINASGAGAGRSDDSAGGGGGGSGGMIALSAPLFTVGTGVALLANGGSGSSGGNDNNNCGCSPGLDPNPLDPTSFTPGGAGGGGTGGIGFAGATMAGDGGDNPSAGLGGGGGGGGGGYIQVTGGQLVNAVASPTPVVVP